MSEVPYHMLERIRKRLINIQHPEIRLWEDEVLKTAVFENSSNWFELLKWLLILLDSSIAKSLENVEDRLTQSLQDVILSLGLLQSSEEVKKCVSGKVCVKERDEFCNLVISAIESGIKSSKGDCHELISLADINYISWMQEVSFEVYRSIKITSKVRKRNHPSSYDAISALIEVDKKHLDSLKDEVEKRKLDVLPPTEDENLTLSQCVEQLKEDRRIKSETLANISSTVEQLWRQVCETYKSEWEHHLPASIEKPKKMPMLEQLTSKMDLLSLLQETLQRTEKDLAVLQERGTIDRELKLSSKNPECWPVNELFIQSSSVKTQIDDLKNSVKWNMTCYK